MFTTKDALVAENGRNNHNIVVITLVIITRLKYFGAA
jgi:hypothetical protein